MHPWKARLSVRNSFFKKIVLSSLVAIILLSGFIELISFTLTTRILMKETDKYSINYLKQIDDNLFGISEDMKQSMESIRDNTEIRDILNRKDQSSFQRYLNADIVDKFLKHIMSNNDNVRGLVLLSKHQSFYIGDRDQANFAYDTLTELPVYSSKIVRLAPNESAIIHPAELGSPQAASESAKPEVLNRIVMVKKLILEQGESAYILSFLSPGFLADLRREGDVFAVDGEGSVIWSRSNLRLDTIKFPYMHSLNGSEKEGSFRKKDRRLVYIQSSIPDWYLVHSVSESGLMGSLNDIKRFFLLSLALFILFSILSASIASKGLTNRIKKLKAVIVQFNGTNSSAPVADPIRAARFPMSLFDSMKYGYKLITYYVCIVILPCLIFILLLYSRSVSAVEAEIIKSVDQYLEQSAANINMLMSRYERNSKYLITNENIQKRFLKTEQDANDAWVTEQTVTAELSDKTIYKWGISNIAIYRKNADLLYSSSSIHSERKAEFAGMLKDNLMWFGTHQDPLNRRIYSLVREIKGNILFSGSYASLIGYLRMDFDESYLSGLYDNIELGDKSAVFVADRQGMIISSRNKDWIGQPYKSVTEQFLDEDIITVSKELQFAGWEIYGTIRKSELLGNKQDLITYNLFLVVVTVLLLIIFSIHSSKVFTRPIQTLKELMDRMVKGDLTVRFTHGARDEIGQLGRSFNHMAERLSYLINESYHAHIREQQLETKKKEAELNALQAQINPHFLYNTFESINWLVRQNENEKAITMITALGDLFRIGIDRGDQLVELEEEIKHAEAYIMIQKLRFGNKLNVSWHDEIDISKYATIKLVLQPIIENAIYHGIELMEEQGDIAIRITAEEENLFIRISDNGLGMDELQLLKVRSGLEDWRNNDTRSIGLRNVNERIKLKFGDTYGLVISSRKNEGTTVTVMLPLLIKVYSGE